MNLEANAAIPAFRRKPVCDGLDTVKGHAAGILCVAPDGDILLLRRAADEKNYGGYWALPGGGVEDGETPELGAAREAREEMGAEFDPAGFKALDQVVTPTGLAFHTFALPVKDKFVPKLNGEHTGYAWASLDMVPRPLHPSVERTLKERVGIADDMTPEDWQGLRDGFLKWTVEEEAEPEHVDGAATDSALVLALDRESVRIKDRDGRLRVAKTNISKANICPYLGREIPGWEGLGLDPDKIYKLLRDPEELAKAAESSNGVPLLRKHVAINAEDHQPHEVVGSLGTDAAFDGEYLTNSLFVNAKDAIDDIESGRKKELSMGYHYTPDMTAGNFGGNSYDGVMRDIVVNHVALVEDGRAGPDVVVGDSMENLVMKTTRLAILTMGVTAAAVAPLLAMDAKITLPTDAFSPLTTKNFKAQRETIKTALRGVLEGKLRKGIALDASIDDVVGLIDKLDGVAGPGADEEAPPEEAKKLDDLAAVEAIAAPVEEKPSADEAFREFLRGKGMGEDDISAAMELLPKNAAADEDIEDDDDEAKPAAKDDGHMKDMVTKTAMDQALKVNAETVAKQVRETERGIRAAIADVRPWVGELAANLAFDSASDVYRHTLKTLGVANADTLHADALQPILHAQAKPGSDKPRSAAVASLGMDGAGVDKALKMVPDLARIQTSM